MTITDVVKMATPNPGWRPDRVARPRHYVMTRPTHFAVEYAINPWMDTSARVDTGLAVRQWEQLVRTYRSLGHTVELVDPIPGLPDMVYAANAGLIINGAAIVARFKHAERAGEATAYAAWMGGRGHQPGVVAALPARVAGGVAGRQDRTPGFAHLGVPAGRRTRTH